MGLIVKRIPHFSALGRRLLIRRAAVTVLGAVAMPAGSRAESAVPQPIATNLVTTSHRLERPQPPAPELTAEELEGCLDKTRSGNGLVLPSCIATSPTALIEAAIGANRWQGR
jgi:hypothetical protein